tara:strand:+ start:493 stop:909 length:417 start_codon:yes stop_codon:yes gene_type:complete
MSDFSNKNSLLDSADSTLPTLNYAVELQLLAAQVGFDWPDLDGVIAKIKEELNEVIAETTIKDNRLRQQDEVGDLLLACTNLARHLNIDPELALQEANQKFYQRFTTLEQLATSSTLPLSQHSPEQLDALWNEVKKRL